MKVFYALVAVLILCTGSIGGASPGGRELPRIPEGITAPELLRIAAPRNPSEADIRGYLQRVFAFSPRYSLADKETVRSKTDLGDQIAMLKAVGPTNLDLLFDESLKARKKASDRLVGHVTREAAESLVTEEHRALCVKAFEKDIELAGLIAGKRWEGDAERALLRHLESYPLSRAGYGASEMDFLRACAMSTSAKVQDALVAFLANPTNRSLLSGLSLNAQGKVTPGLAVRVWSKIKKDSDAPTGWAVLAMEAGDVSALRRVANGLSNGVGGSSSVGSKYRVAAVCKLTDAPRGEPGEVAAWVLSRIDRLVWDEASGRFVEK